MEIFLTALHVLLCIFMILVILLQPGKDGIGGGFGGAATSAFGGRGATTILGKITAGSAVAFFITSLALSFATLKPSIADAVEADVSNEQAAAGNDGATGTEGEAPTDPADAPAGEPSAAGDETSGDRDPDEAEEGDETEGETAEGGEEESVDVGETEGQESTP